jgi:Amt family ammonium transporter
VVVTLAWSAVATFLIVKLVQIVCGLRVSDEEIIEGLDFSAHGEQGYNL